MRLKLDKQKLCNAVSIVNHAISSKTTMPILEGIKIKTVTEGVKLTCYDMTLGIETVIPATVQEDGEAVVPGRLFYEISRKLPNDADVDLYFSESFVEITCAGSKTKMQTLPVEDFPMLPEVDEENVFEYSQEKIKDMIKKTLFAAAIDESRPILTGILFEIVDNSLKLVSLDGYRMAIAGHDMGEKRRKRNGRRAFFHTCRGGEDNTKRGHDKNSVYKGLYFISDRKHQNGQPLDRRRIYKIPSDNTCRMADALYSTERGACPMYRQSLDDFLWRK